VNERSYLPANVNANNSKLVLQSRSNKFVFSKTHANEINNKLEIGNENNRSKEKHKQKPDLSNQPRKHQLLNK